MTAPIRPWVFAVAYVVAVAALVALPSTTIDGERRPLPARPAPVARPLGEAATQVDAPTVAADRRTSAAPVLTAPANSSPVRIRLPRLGIDGPVSPVGLASDRQLDVPTPDQAGWYQHSAAPGRPGASVIAAHVDFAGREGLFFALGAAEVGDEILLDLPDGTTERYVVTDVALHDKTSLPATELFRTGGSHVVHLVTCGGTFDRDSRSYRGNQVVTAVPAPAS